MEARKILTVVLLVLLFPGLANSQVRISIPNVRATTYTEPYTPVSYYALIITASGDSIDGSGSCETL